MSLSVRSNSASLRAQRILGRTSQLLSATLERLSSGDRINRASDDAGGLAISESLKVRAKVAAKGIRNSQDGISALTIADAALGEITTILGRMSELAEQSANGTLSSSQRATLNKEFRALGLEIQRVSEVTSFNGAQLIIQRPTGNPTASEDISDTSGIDLSASSATANYYNSFSSNSITFQVGFNSTATSRITTNSINASITGRGLGNYYVVEDIPPRPEAEYFDRNIRAVTEAQTS